MTATFIFEITHVDFKISLILCVTTIVPERTTGATSM